MQSTDHYMPVSADASPRHDLAFAPDLVTLMVAASPAEEGGRRRVGRSDLRIGVCGDRPRAGKVGSLGPPYHLSLAQHHPCPRQELNLRHLI